MVINTCYFLITLIIIITIISVTKLKSLKLQIKQSCCKENTWSECKIKRCVRNLTSFKSTSMRLLLLSCNIKVLLTPSVGLLLQFVGEGVCSSAVNLKISVYALVSKPPLQSDFIKIWKNTLTSLNCITLILETWVYTINCAAQTWLTIMNIHWSLTNPQDLLRSPSCTFKEVVFLWKWNFVLSLLKRLRHMSESSRCSRCSRGLTEHRQWFMVADSRCFSLSGAR